MSADRWFVDNSDLLLTILTEATYMHESLTYQQFKDGELSLFVSTPVITAALTTLTAPFTKIERQLICLLFDQERSGQILMDNLSKRIVHFW